MSQPMGAPEPREWLTQQIRLTQAMDREVLAVLQQARRDINRMLREVEAREGIGAAIRAEQLRLVRRNLMREQAAVWRKLGNIIGARRLKAASNAIQLSQQIDRMLLTAYAGFKDGAKLAESIAQAELDYAERSLDRMIARVQGDSYTPLSERVYNSQVNFGATIDRRINSALTRGLSAREFAREMSDFINPTTPGGIRYAAMRLARTEINNAAHATAIEAARTKPWTEGMQWHLSSSHPRPDECDKFAKGGRKGDGVYPPNEVPKKPHPHCFCFVTPVLPSEEDFLNNLVDGQYDDFLAQFRNRRPGEIITVKLG